MSARKATLTITALCLALAALLPAAASAVPAPAWTLTLTPMPANFDPGAEHNPEYMVVATNVGGGPTTADPTVLETTLPEGLTPVSAGGSISDLSSSRVLPCVIGPIDLQVVTCKTAETIHPGRLMFAQIEVEVTAPEGTLTTEATISGGGAAQAVSASSPTSIQADSVPFDFLPGFKAPLNEEDGAPAVLAGSHPYQQTLAFGFPTELPGDLLTNDGHPRNLYVELPRGMVGITAASTVLCTEAELTGAQGCPRDSQVGVTDVTTLIGQLGGNVVTTSNLYNMVPPPGAAAEFATNVAGVGLYSHTVAGVRSDDDYGIEATTRDVIALGIQPIFNVQAQIWGNPSAKAHDAIRGECLEFLGSCPALSDPNTALLTMPSDCPGAPLPFEVFVDSWEEPAPEFQEREAFYESADLTGAPVAVEGCEELEFEPTIEARPTTNLTDSPAGFDFTLHQPQDTDADSRAPANLKDTVIRFPAGLAINPSQANGLGACSEDQIGFEGEEEGRLFFSKDPQSCPDAAKIGSLEVTSPALVARNPAHEVERDPEGKLVLEALQGSLYIAKPFANPFGSLIAVYLVIEDPKTGIVVKLATEARPDPLTGQLTTTLTEAPEFPVEDFKVHLFGGPRGAFLTPPTCAVFTTEADLVPWSAPEGEDAFPSAGFQTTQTPLGGPCPTTEAQLPNAPKLSAGTLNPSAGKYSPLLFKLSREDGTQRFSRIETTAPSGLIAKLAGVASCSEAEIAKARSREVPEKGALEQSDPSCPAASQIGAVVAGAGAGPTPYYTTGRVYLAGPYKGAPISIVAIAPAVAGPFDLGAVVIRSALYLDPVTAQARVLSDPLPSVLQGIPVDVRSVAVRLDRAQFTLNPTSCAVKSFGGSVFSTLGQAAPLSQRFQVGGCKSLPYKPKLSVRLFGPTHRGAHPRLRAVFTAKPGEANTAAVSFTFPKSEFIDQAHFRTICTRVQFAAGQCPAGSVYGHARAFSPLLDYPVEGPIYLRSSAHKLPDVVLSLHGPPSQPLAFEAAARVDSVKGGLRMRFESVPDAPLSKVILSAQGAKKGLFQNSTDICKGAHRATLLLDAQSGKTHDTQPKLVAQCKGGKGKGGKKAAKREGRR